MFMVIAQLCERKHETYQKVMEYMDQVT
uniref:Uncharacterized protein n=1 Tax=Rhizophora mucronata TaxID=61149 RepID=A0A2P2QCQ0_RHIMU